MAYSLANTIFEFVNSTNEVIFDKLLIESTRRKSDLSVVHDIARLWKRPFSISSENAVQAYIQILQNIRSDFDKDSGIYMYTIISLELVEMNRALGKALWSEISSAKIDAMIKHKEHTKCDRSFNRPYLNFLLSSESNLQEFIKWHETISGLGNLIGTQITMRPCNAVYKIWQAIKRKNGTEYDKIRLYVHEFMEALCSELQNSETMFRCIPSLVGSAKENTRNVHPD